MNRSGFLRRIFGFLGRRAEHPARRHADAEEREMIAGILELGEKTVREVMVPRIDSVFLNVGMKQRELVTRISESGHSRFPVYEETLDNVVGVLYAKDLLQYLTNGRDIDVAATLRKPFFVPESKRLDSLLREMRRRRVHIAVAVDEFGGVSGIVCMEDIIEEIVGDIQDEFDNEREDILTIGDDVYLCDARVNIADIQELLDIPLPDEDYDTLGGFVFDLFGKIPVKFEKVAFENLHFVVQDMEGHKIKTIKIIRHSEKESSSDA